MLRRRSASSMPSMRCMDAPSKPSDGWAARAPASLRRCTLRVRLGGDPRQVGGRILVSVNRNDPPGKVPTPFAVSRSAANVPCLDGLGLKVALRTQVADYEVAAADLIGGLLKHSCPLLRSPHARQTLHRAE